MDRPPSYLAIDVGGTKTLAAVFSDSGELVFEQRFETNSRYPQFLADLSKILDEIREKYSLVAVCCAIPGKVDRSQGIGEHFGNLKWRYVPIGQDISKILEGIDVLLENDANLAGLSEALLVQQKYKKVIYLTISTGIGDGIIINGMIDPTLADSESGQMALEHEGKIKKWEDFASGRALVKRFGKRASELNDPAAWRAFAKDIARGLDQLIAIVQPDVIIIGGGVGSYFEKYGDMLKDELKKLENDMVKIPPVIKAKRAEEAVIYGCYDFIKQKS